MAKKSKNPLMFVGVIIVLVVIGVFVFAYTQQKDEPSQGQNTTNSTCRPLEGKDYIGLSEAEAVDKAKSVDQGYRIVERDGKSFPVNLDLNECRINFIIKNGVVTKAEFY